MNALGPCGSIDLDGQRRLTRGHVDQDGPRLRAGERAMIAERHFADIARITDDREDDVGSLRDRPG